VFQRDTVFPWRTVADNIGYGSNSRASGARSGANASRPRSTKRGLRASPSLSR